MMMTASRDIAALSQSMVIFHSLNRLLESFNAPLHFFAFTNPTSGKEDEYNTWYDEHHLKDVINVPGFVSARRFVSPRSSSRSIPNH